MTTDIVTALIGAVGIVVAALVPTLVLHRGQAEIKSTQAEIKENLGVPNGTGTVIEQGNQQLDELAALRLAQDKHAALDSARFQILHHHLNIPFPEELPE